MIEIMKIIDKIKDSPRFFLEWLGFSFGFLIGLLKNPLIAFIFLEVFLFVLLIPTERVMIAYVLQFSATAYVILGQNKAVK
ncbi:hypothetical protein [Polynucleobacter sp.]|uniref:hypothetical protein n=1 Tax=Polynucleobacter sp. TaxID=2029855 RepID=UPI003F699172